MNHKSNLFFYLLFRWWFCCYIHTHTIMCKSSCRFNISSNPLTAILLFFFTIWQLTHRVPFEREKNMLFVIVKAKYCLLVDVKHFHIFSAHIKLYYSAEICTNSIRRILNFFALFPFFVRCGIRIGDWNGG